MDFVRLFFAQSAPPATDEERTARYDAVEWLLEALWRNGQTWTHAAPICVSDAGISSFVTLPEPEALSPVHRSLRVAELYAALPAAGLAAPEVTVLGEDPEVGWADECASRSSFVLFTTMVHRHSPLRCGECFDPVPLYRIPRFPSTGCYQDIVWWQRSYQQCDLLQMGCGVASEVGQREMSRLDSRLSEDGLAIARRIEESTGTPTYYYLYRAEALRMDAERKRRCPGCRGQWLLNEPWHGRFHFRCDRCRLISNIAYSEQIVPAF